jgi:FkbM family methyltransferase
MGQHCRRRRRQRRPVQPVARKRFEPVPSTQKKFKDNLKLNPQLASRITLVESGLSEQATGTVSFALDRAHPVNHAVFDQNGADAANTLTVPVTSLDAYFAGDPEAKIGFLKLDVEGLEESVLRGAAGLLANGRIAVVYVEMIDWQLQRAGSSIARVTEFLQEYGLVPVEAKAFLKGELKPLSLAEARNEAGKTDNVIFASAATR